MILKINPSLRQRRKAAKLDQDQSSGPYRAWEHCALILLVPPRTHWRGDSEVSLNSNGRSLPNGPPRGGPSIAAVALWGSSEGNRVQLFTDEERAQLAVISLIVRFKKGDTIYQEGDRADAVFNIVSGVAKTYKILPDGTQHIVAFLFADDLLGLAEEGRYVNSAEAVTAVTGYRIPASAIESRLRRDPDLEFHVLCKLCHELREAQRHAVVLSKRRALAKVATTFLQILDTHQTARGESPDEIYLPMSRSDFGHYVGMSPEAVSRSFSTLTSRGVITLRDRRRVKIVDRDQLESIASEAETRTPPSTAV